MFPNQPGRDSWGSPVQGSGYYGSGYGPTGSWYNWTGQASNRSTNSWGYNPQPHGLEPETASGAQSPYSKSSKLGINTNIYSIYQNRSQSQVPHDSNSLHPQLDTKLTSPRSDLMQPELHQNPRGGVQEGQGGVPVGQGGVPVGQGGVPVGQGGVSGGQGAESESAEALFTSCMQE